MWFCLKAMSCDSRGPWQRPHRTIGPHAGSDGMEEEEKGDTEETLLDGDDARRASRYRRHGNGIRAQTDEEKRDGHDERKGQSFYCR